MAETLLFTDAYNFDLAPMAYGYEACKPDHAYGQTRPYYLIHYILSGHGVFRTEGKKYHLKAGCLFVIHPGQANSYQADATDPWTYAWIIFQSEKPLHFENIIYCPEAEAIFKAFEEKKADMHSTPYLKARLWDLVALLDGNKNANIKFIDDALAFMHTEYMHELSITDIAQRVGLSRSYFTVLFKEKLGVSPKTYLFNHRMHCAVSLLTIYRRSVSETAQAIGYPDMFTFSKAFKKKFGISPKQFAAANKADAYPHSELQTSN